MRRYSSIVLGLLMAATSCVASTPAQAAASWECDATYSCFYTERNGTGSRWVAPTGGCHHPLPSWLQDNISSVRNRGHSTAYVHLYNWVGYWEHLITIAPGERVNLNASDNKTDRICIDS